jgi:hypothetical protein
MTAATTGQWHEVLTKTEWVAIVTWDGQQPHTIANWGDYIRALSEPGSDTLVMPAGQYHRTGANLRGDRRVQVILASRQVAGSHGPQANSWKVKARSSSTANGPAAPKPLTLGRAATSSSIFKEPMLSSEPPSTTGHVLAHAKSRLTEDGTSGKRRCRIPFIA